MTRPIDHLVWPLLATALTAAGLTAVALGGDAGASDAPPSGGYVPIVPCRLFDTRPAPFNVGDRSRPIGPKETLRQQVVGAVGNCTIPSDAVGVDINTTAVNGTADSFLTVAPAGDELPLSSSLNWVAGDPPTPNQISVRLSADGAIDLYNQFGSVDVVGDVVGYSTTADLDALRSAIDQNDDEILDLTSEFNTLDDAVSLKANAADVYTKGEVYRKDEVYSRETANALHAPIPMAGGAVTHTGTEFPGAFQFGTWSVTKTGTGTYRVDMLSRNGCAGLPRPFALVTAAFPPRMVSADVANCESNGSWRFFVETRDESGALQDNDWQFAVYG